MKLNPTELEVLLWYYRWCYDIDFANQRNEGLREVCERLVERQILERLNSPPNNIYTCGDLGQFFVEHVLTKQEVPSSKSIKVEHDPWSNVSRVVRA